MITILEEGDAKITALLDALHKNHCEVGSLKGVPSIHQQYKPYTKERRNWIHIDENGSGMFLVDRKTEQVYSILAYGRPNKKKPRGTVEFLTRFINECTDKGQEYRQTYWYKLHPTE